MKKDLIIPIIFVVIIIGAAIIGVLHSTNKSNQTKTAVIPHTADTHVVSVPITDTKYFIYYELIPNLTGNTTISFVNGTYFINLNGVINYPPSYLNPGNYTLIYIETSISFTNGTTEYYVLPVYQEIMMNGNTPIKFYLVLEGNSPALYTFYNAIEYMLKQGIDSMQVTFELLQNNEYSYQIHGVLNL